MQSCTDRTTHLDTSSKKMIIHGNRFKVLRWAVGLPFSVATAASAANVATTNAPSAIPWNQIGARASANYHGDGLAVTPTESGAPILRGRFSS